LVSVHAVEKKEGKTSILAIGFARKRKSKQVGDSGIENKGEPDTARPLTMGKKKHKLKRARKPKKKRHAGRA